LFPFPPKKDEAGRRPTDREVSEMKDMIRTASQDGWTVTKGQRLTVHRFAKDFPAMTYRVFRELFLDAHPTATLLQCVDGWDEYCRVRWTV
jgi:hypothetical protein